MEHNNYTSRLAHLREKAKAFTFVVFGGSMILDSFNVEGLAFDQISIATKFWDQHRSCQLESECLLPYLWQFSAFFGFGRYLPRIDLFPDLVQIIMLKV